ncbi:VPLPA-CTERM sorting domain-containing protein [Rhodovulum sp. DZ06]|uniref:VPLPA-CTERM sorting domain-containing protein n=1 Tax=Rhodovulum sp. DZ06 TaxID=3425126 RepID=UPI003D32A803
MKRIACAACLSAAAVLAGGGAGGAHAAPYYLNIGLEPFGDRGNQVAMDRVFGEDAWILGNYRTVDAAALLASADFLFLEGGDFLANDLEAFLDANRAALEQWVFDGGRLLVNAAPTEGDGMSFILGAQLVFPLLSDEAVASDPLHPVFDGVTTRYTGNQFAHGRIANGGAALIEDAADGEAVLSYRMHGAGLAVFGGMTTVRFQSPSGDAETLRANLIDWTANGELRTSEVPLPASALLLLAGVAVMGAVRRRAA